RKAGALSVRVRSYYRRSAVARAAIIVFGLTLALVGAVVFTLDRSARQSNRDRMTSELAASAHVAVAAFATVRADLRTRAGQLATSLPVQRAVLERNAAAVTQIARANRAKIVSGRIRADALPPRPRLLATAMISSNGRVLAW